MRIISVLILIFGLVSCQTVRVRETTSLQPGTKAYTRLLVVSPGKETSAREEVENAFSKHLKKGAFAVKASEIGIAGGTTPGAELLNQCKSKELEAVLFVEVKETNAMVVELPAPSGRKNEITNTTIFNPLIEVVLYDCRTNQKVWSGLTEPERETDGSLSKYPKFTKLKSAIAHSARSIAIVMREKGVLPPLTQNKKESEE